MGLLDDIRDITDRCFNCKRHFKDKETKPCDMCKPLPVYPRMAPEGQIFVCGACGKTSKDLYGGQNSRWDESCMMNAVLCHENSIKKQNGLVTNAKAVEGYQ